MNTRGEEDEDTIHQCFSKFRSVRNHIGTFTTNQYLRVKNWKVNPILTSKVESLNEF